MGFSYGPSIATTGLIFYVDAGNTKSYPGSGTIVTDLSGNGYEGTLVNSPTHTAGSSGYWTFNGTSSLINFTTVNLSTTATWTVFGIARYNGLGGNVRGRIISSYGNNWLMGHHSASTTNFYAGGWVGAAGSGTGTNDNLWRIYHATGNVTSGQYQLYVNKTSTLGPTTGGTVGPNGFTLGAYGAAGSPSEYSNGDCAFLGAYNRVLSFAEVVQNFDALKLRYGL